MKKYWLLIAAFTMSCGGTGDVAITYPTLDCDPLVPEFCGFPFPSNVYASDDDTTTTGRRVSFGPQLLRTNDSAPWDRSDGFSAGTPILTYLPGATGTEFAAPSDVAPSLAEDSPTILIAAETGERIPHFAELDLRAGQANQRAIHIRPVVRLDDATRYIVALRNLRDDTDTLIAPSPAFAALRDGTASTEASVEARAGLYQDIFKRLGDAGVAREEVQIAWDFTTASDENNTRDLLHMRDEALALVGAEGPMFDTETLTVENDWNTDHIAFRIFGTMRVPLYMTTDEPGSVLVRDEAGLPMINPDTPWADIPFEVLIPNSALTTPAALLQYGHGLLGTASQIESSHFRSFIDEYNYIFFGTDLQGMSNPDFFPISGALAGGDLAALQTMFDRLHQGFLNSLMLMRMMKGRFATDSDFADYIDPTEAYYYGISQGGIMGTVYLALSTDVERGALGVMGQPYSLLLLRSVDFTPFLETLQPHYPDLREQQLAIALFQMLWDRAEPTGYSHHITSNPLPNTPTKEVLMRVAIGDHQVTTLGGHLMARSLGAPHLDTGLREIWGLDSVSSTTSGSFYTEYDFGLPGEPACGVPMSLCDDPHEHVRRLESAREQLDEFFRNGTGTNHCPEGVCSFPEQSGCDEEEDAAALAALCEP